MSNLEFEKSHRGAPGWKAYVQNHLAPLRLGAEREVQMIEEMAQHLEAIYEDALANGDSEQDAFTRAAAHIKATGMRSSTSFPYLTFERIRDHNEPLSGVFALVPFGTL